jgi:KaiC/GvpD/RAD55 family RecA-like ATPase
MKGFDEQNGDSSTITLCEAEKEKRGTTFISGLTWFDSLLPFGLPVPSSILISGASGTGKPFVGLSVAGSWLRQGGRVIFIPIHSDHSMLFTRGLRALYNISLEEYAESHFFILFDTDLFPNEDSLELQGSNTIRCNLVNPKVWQEALSVASASMEGEGPILVFASALNLLLFSPSYGEQLFSMLLDTVRDTRGWTYLLNISSSIQLKKSIILEQAADHLFLMKRVPRNRLLYLRAARIRNTVFHNTAVPIPDMLDFIEDLRNEAVASRRILIPKVSKI